MNINRTLELTNNESIRPTWIAWMELLIRSDASRFVVNSFEASDDLIRIFDKGYPKEQMEKWLREWPTPNGWEAFFCRRESH